MGGRLRVLQDSGLLPGMGIHHFIKQRMFALSPNFMSVTDLRIVVHHTNVMYYDASTGRGRHPLLSNTNLPSSLLIPAKCSIWFNTLQQAGGVQHLHGYKPLKRESN